MGNPEHVGSGVQDQGISQCVSLSSRTLMLKERALVQRIEQQLPDIMAGANAAMEPYRKAKARYIAVCEDLLRSSKSP